MAVDSDRPRIRMAVSAYDRVASWIIALNVTVGSLVLVLAIIFCLSNIGSRTATLPAEVELLEEHIAGRGDHAAGYGRDAEPPGMEEMADAMADVMEPQLENLLEAVPATVSSDAIALDVIEPPVFTTNVGSGMGDSRPPGPLGEGDEIIPRGERWEIRYNSTNVAEYAQQLDFFRIELGAVGGGEKQVDYALNLRKSPPDRRQGPSEEEKRLYMFWTNGNLRRFDRQLLTSAGVRTTGRIIVQFYAKEVENSLAQLELAYARANGKNSVKQIKQTVFGVRRQGNGFEYYVLSQRYRVVPS